MGASAVGVLSRVWRRLSGLRGSALVGPTQVAARATTSAQARLAPPQPTGPIVMLGELKI